MRFLIILLSLFVITNASVLDQFRRMGVEFEVYGEGRLVPEKQSCMPYTMDLNSFVNSLNMNEMSEYSRELLKRRVFSSFDKICRGFNITTDSEVPPNFGNLEADRQQMRYMDRFELSWNTLKFERDLNSLFLENKINNPFLELIEKDTIARSGSSDATDFSHRSTIFPKMCNVQKLTIDVNICFNISEIPQSGMIYAIAHGGEFLHDENVFAYYQLPEFVLITPKAVFPVDLEKCKVLYGTYIYCFEEINTQCDVTTFNDCPIFAYKSDEDFIFRRNYGVSRIIATTETEIDLFENGTKTVVPDRVFVLRTVFGVPKTTDDEPEVTGEMTAHVTETSQFAELLPESLAILKKDTPTRLYTTQKRGVNLLSHKHYDQGAWDAVRNFFGFRK